MHSWVGEVNVAIFCSCVGLDLQLCFVGRGGGCEDVRQYGTILSLMSFVLPNTGL